VASGHVKGFMILDEPIWNGVSVSEITSIANTIKTDFPTAIVWVTEAAPVFTQGVDIFGAPVNMTSVPTGIDWIGFDEYGDPAVTQTHYQTYMYPKMNANQRAVLVPQAYGSNNNPGQTLAQYESSMISAADAYYNWAKTDTKVIGFIPWHWLTPDPMWWTGYYEVGARNMPGLKSKWQTIGSEVRANNIVAAKTTDMSFIQGFDWYTITDPRVKKRLPSTYTATPWGADTNAPAVANVYLNTEQKYSGTTSVGMAGTYASPAAWRYCWGTNPQNYSRIWKGHPTQYFQLMMKIPNEGTLAMDMIPYRSYSGPVAFSFGSGGFFLADNNGGKLICDWSVFNDSAWNKIKVKIAMGSLTDRNDDKIWIWINDVLKYQGSFVPRSEVLFDSIGFFLTSGSCYIDDMGMWGETGCGDWGYYGGDVDRDCTVSFKDFAKFASEWFKCTDPNNWMCVQAN
jgi:hypothetical protein